MEGMVVTTSASGLGGGPRWPRTGRYGDAVCEFSYRDHARNVTRPIALEAVQRTETRTRRKSLPTVQYSTTTSSCALPASCDMHLDPGGDLGATNRARLPFKEPSEVPARTEMRTWHRKMILGAFEAN